MKFVTDYAQHKDSHLNTQLIFAYILLITAILLGMLTHTHEENVNGYIMFLKIIINVQNKMIRSKAPHIPNLSLIKAFYCCNVTKFSRVMINLVPEMASYLKHP